jgi:hypothetical protein
MDVPLTTPGFIPRMVEDDELPFDPKTLAPKNAMALTPVADLEAEVPETVIASLKNEEVVESEPDEPTEEELAESGSDPDSPLDCSEVDSDGELQPAFNFEE